tara:strand:+ start:1835 stop:2161 length:327 start_codon:yes stop_codon:yes gene_type:complete
MDKRIKYMAYMWREFNDEWYRIQTNSPTLIDKLKRRIKRGKSNVSIIGKTLIGSSNYWLIFKIKYNKPSTAKRGFIRLTGCKNNYTYRNGCYKAEMSPNGMVKSGVKV